MSGHEMDALVARVRARAEVFGGTLTALAAIRADAVGLDGRVRIEVDGDGRVTDLWLAESLHDVDARALEQTIVDAAHRAAAAAAGEHARIVGMLSEPAEDR
ncbi:YbaB/EbfC family nucleoid-associated protein [Prescottella sp. R16]|uniref:YbaB/EbfC family nucleoid-associated protein n=1 Tax=Prescottella sp. R16 TaxID=3064529 RepID=UPI00272DCC1C|nr:YbaB/EbfC family nucleoid-associated protein [Prescottella sp. R16]